MDRIKKYWYGSIGQRTNMKIKYVKYGLANNFGDVIEVNENLRKYPELLKPILIHELNHTDKVFTLQDLTLDLTATHNINQRKLMKFMIKHPKSLTQLLPVYFSKNHGLVYDINLILSYVMYISLIVVGIILGVILL